MSTNPTWRVAMTFYVRADTAENANGILADAVQAGIGDASEIESSYIEPGTVAWTDDPPITVLAVAEYRGAKYIDGKMSGAEIERVGLPFFGGCELCAASIAAYNAHPSTSGFLRCFDCIGESGFATVAAFEAWQRSGTPDEPVRTFGCPVCLDGSVLSDTCDECGTRHCYRCDPCDDEAEVQTEADG